MLDARRYEDSNGYCAPFIPVRKRLKIARSLKICAYLPFLVAKGAVLNAQLFALIFTQVVEIPSKIFCCVKLNLGKGFVTAVS